MLAHVEALVGGVDDDCVVGESVAVEIVEHTSDAFVYACDDRHIVAYVDLIFPIIEVFATEVSFEQFAVAREVITSPRRALFGSHSIYLAHESVVRVLAVLIVHVEHLRHLEILLPPHILSDAHLLRAGSRPTCGIVVVEGFWQRKFYVVVATEIFYICLPITVWRLMMEQEAEWTRGVAMVDEVESVVGSEVGGIAFLHDILVASVRSAILRVPILSLVVVDVIIVEALRVASHVPFSHNSRLVASLLQQFGEESASCVDAFAKLSLSVLIAIHTRHKAGARRRRERVLHEGAVEPHTTLCQSVDVGCRCKLGYCATISTDTLKGMVVTHNVNDVGTLAR